MQNLTGFTKPNVLSGVQPRQDLCLDGAAIYTKIDWLTVMFQDMSLSDVLEFVHLLDQLDEFVKGCYERSQGLDDFFVFSYEGISIEARKVYLYGHEVDESLFDITIPQMRLDISGSGLDFLRSLGIEPETYFRNYDSYPQPFHLTRMDFAFDLVNYAPTLVDEVIDYCNSSHTDSYRLCIYGMPSGLKYRMALGGQKTIYIGATTSERMLRIYDKKLQYIDHRTGIYNKDNPYENPESWIRLELQLRRKSAEKIAFDNSDMCSILKYIYENYCFADTSNTNSHTRRPAAFWQSLFDWNTIPRIIQNFDKVSIVSAEDRVVRTFFSRNIVNFMLTVSILGEEKFREMCDEFMQDLNNQYSPLCRKRLRSVLLKINSCNVHVDGYSEGFYNVNPFGSVKQLGFKLKGWDNL